MEPDELNLPSDFMITPASSWMTEIPTQIHRYNGPCTGVYVDIGAHVGIVAVRAVLAGFPFVYCYEPSPESYRLLLQNLVRVKEPSQTALAFNFGIVGESTEEFVLYDYSLAEGEDRANTGMRSGLYKPSERVIHAKVTSFPLVDVIGLHDSVEYLKVDAEGGEYDMFRPSLELDNALRKVQNLSLELHSVDDGTFFNSSDFDKNHSWFSCAESAPVELIEYLHGLGFTDMTYEEVMSTDCQEFFSVNHNFVEASE